LDRIDELIRSMKQNDAQCDADKVRAAFEMADSAHEGQMRKSGEPYIMHPVEVAIILADMGMDTESIVAALLHDVVEDTDIPLEDLRRQFGDETAHLVDGVTKLSKIPFSSREEHQAENVRKMLIAMAKDVRVIIIKLADRLHNMRTIEHVSEQKQRDKSLETMEVYAPIAHRMGIRAIKEELEDISLRYLDPIAYQEISARLQTGKEEREKFLSQILRKFQERLQGHYNNLAIEGRVKSMYSIYRKLYVQGRSFDEIFDVYAIRVLVDTVNECYNVLGEVHDIFRPIPNRFKDYISTPKANMYQSLHTTVFDKSATPFEVQIRTFDMHHTAEYGIAAHWKYKVGVRQGKDSLEEKIAWVRQLLESQKDSVDAGDIIGSIKSDLTADEVYVFTPKGDVISLPLGASIIDFAYAIHTEVGNRMIGAKIDGRMVSLDTQVHTGQIINIITTSAKDHGPSRDWINIVKTSSTRSKIRAWFKKERRDENIAQGKAELEKEFRRNNILLDDKEMEAFLIRLTKNQRLNSLDEFLAALGYGGISLSKIMPRIKEQYQKLYKDTESEEKRLQKQVEKAAAQKPKAATSAVIVEGLENCLTKYSKCCNPLPGDHIIGFITRGHGVSIHTQSCSNVVGPMFDSEQADRWVECRWADVVEREEMFKSTVDIYGKDRPGLLVDISIALNNMHVPIYALTAKEQPGEGTAIQITFGIRNTEQLTHITRSLRKIAGVDGVERAMQ